MAEISDWELSRLEEREKKYFKLQKEKNDLCHALIPIFKEVFDSMDYETLYNIKKAMDEASLGYE